MIALESASDVGKFFRKASTRWSHSRPVEDRSVLPRMAIARVEGRLGREGRLSKHFSARGGFGVLALHPVRENAVLHTQQCRQHERELRGRGIDLQSWWHRREVKQGEGRCTTICLASAIGSWGGRAALAAAAASAAAAAAGAAFLAFWPFARGRKVSAG